MAEAPQVMNKRELLAAIRRDRAKLEELIARVGEARMTEPVLEGDRSVKDVLAHISAWEKICLALVRNRTPIDPPAPGETSSSTDAINQKVYEDNRDRPLQEVVAEEQRSYAAMLTLIEGLSDEAVLAVQGDGAEEGERVSQLISGNSDAHYREHTEQIERWLEAHP